MIKEEDLCEAFVCKKEETAYDAANVLKDLKVRHLVVVDDNESPIGFLSQTDLVEKVLAENKLAKEVKIEDIMTEGIMTVELGENYEDAYNAMCKIRTFSIPVVKEKHLVGILDFSKLVDCIEKEGETQ